MNESGVLPEPDDILGADAVCLWETDVITVVFGASADADVVDSERWVHDSMCVVMYLYVCVLCVRMCKIVCLRVYL